MGLVQEEKKGEKFLSWSNRIQSETITEDRDSREKDLTEADFLKERMQEKYGQG